MIKQNNDGNKRNNKHIIIKAGLCAALIYMFFYCINFYAIKVDALETEGEKTYEYDEIIHADPESGLPDRRRNITYGLSRGFTGTLLQRRLSDHRKP